MRRNGGSAATNPGKPCWISSNLLAAPEQPIPVADPDGIVMDEEDFLRLRRLVHHTLGICWEDHKREMVYYRLRKRVKHLGLGSFARYCHYLTHQDDPREWQELYNAVTTNQTAFFRGPLQFEFLENHWLKGLRHQAMLGRPRKLRLWSAACSNGAEPYSLAMTLLEGLGPGWDVRILASDINTRVLEYAASGCYTREESAAIPPRLRDKYFKKIDRHQPAAPYCARQALREMIQFRPINLMDHHYPIKVAMEVILCRNVLIYFDKSTRETLVQRLVAHLAPGGYLLLGHAETLPELPGMSRLPHNIHCKDV